VVPEDGCYGLAALLASLAAVPWQAIKQVVLGSQ